MTLADILRDRHHDCPSCTEAQMCEHCQEEWAIAAALEFIEAQVVRALESKPYNLTLALERILKAARDGVPE